MYCYMAFSDAKKGKLGNKYDPTNSLLYAWFENEESTYTKTKNDLPPMPALEGFE